MIQRLFTTRCALATLALCSAAEAGGDTFLAGIALPLTGGASALAVGDVDGDGRSDLLAWTAVDGFAGRIELLPGLPSGGLGRPVLFPELINFPTLGGMDLADANGDGNLDLVTYPAGVMLGDGAGGFAAPLGLPSIPWPVSDIERMLVPDLNGDGVPDMVFVSGVLGTFVALGNGDGTFTTFTPLPSLPVTIGYLPRDAAVGDLDEDGIPDIVLAANNLGLWWYRGDGAGNFENAVALTPGTLTSFLPGMQLTDLNGDGHLDVVAVQADIQAMSSLMVAFGDGDGGLDLPSLVNAPVSAPPFGPQHLSLADIDGDGDDDALLTGSPWLSSTTVRTFEQVAPGVFVFGADHAIASASGIASPVVASLSGDDLEDLVIGQAGLIVPGLQPFVSLGYEKPLAAGSVTLVGAGGTSAGDLGALLLSSPAGSLAAVLLGTGVQWIGLAPGHLAPSAAVILPIVPGGQLTAIPYVWPGLHPPTVTAFTLQAWATDGVSLGTSELLAVVAQ